MADTEEDEKQQQTRRASVALELQEAARTAVPDDAVDLTSGQSTMEKKWMAMRSPESGVSDRDKLLALLEDEVLWEKRAQRKQDLQNDHPLALFTRLKYQSRGTLLWALFLLTIIHLVQIGAMYNLTGLSSYLVTDKIAVMVERGDWVIRTSSSGYAAGLLQAQYNASTFPDKVHGLFNSSEVYLPGVQAEFGFCLSEQGYLETLFNITCGLFLVFLFVFSDLWRVIFATPITRSFPGDPHFKLVLMGIGWLILLNSLILCWLGVESGLSVVASGGEFSAVLFNSLANFLILSLDDEVLPLLRFLLEENGRVNEEGWVLREQLDLLTHGTQYYKPGYGVNWVNTILHARYPILRVIAVVNVPIMLGIVFVPLGYVIHVATQTYELC